jgi:hypothetical protein
MIKRTKTKWMRPVELAALWGTSKQNINGMKARGAIASKKDRYGNVLVQGLPGNR